MRGRKPKPTHLKVVTGNPGKRPLNQAEPKPEAAARVEAPLWLDDVGRVEWDRTISSMVASGVLAKLDLAAFEQYCATYQQWMEYERAIAKFKADAKDELYLLAIDKLVLRRNQTVTLLKGLAAELGMTPSSRSRVTAVEAGDDADDEFFGNGAG